MNEAVAAVREFVDREVIPVARELEAARRPGGGTAKLLASEVALECATEAMRIHGGYGYSPEYVAERLYRDAPLLVIGEGTNEIQQPVIARRLLES
jgi:alkylation response protein AidB-like acyl-CoA dehydrogenase